MSRIKPGSRKQKEILKKRALKKGKFRKFVELDFFLYKRKNKIPFDFPSWKTDYEPPFSNFI